MTFKGYTEIARPLEEFATIHPVVPTARELFDKLASFSASKWAFRGQGKDWRLRATIDRVATKPGVAEDYVMREFSRRAHHYLAHVPRHDDDLEWLALIQH